MNRFASACCLLLPSGDSASLMTVASSTGVSLRPSGVLRDLNGLRMLAKVSRAPLLCRTCSVHGLMKMLLCTPNAVGGQGQRS